LTAGVAGIFSYRAAFGFGTTTEWHSYLVGASRGELAIAVVTAYSKNHYEDRGFGMGSTSPPSDLTVPSATDRKYGAAGFIFLNDPGAIYGAAQKAFFVPCWFLAFISAVLAALTFRASRGIRLAKPGHCYSCGYDLRASPDRCPECGTAFCL
jgi:hypothetical protein